jgi:hypothetical protein
LSEANRAAWESKRAELEQRRDRRTDCRRFRQNPEDYLQGLENKLNQSRLQN